ncbi:hypothetical protein GAP52_032 [Cronobacter phage vB_CsaP_GAP52]|uniref:Uncharacterized protein n=1 Tax=Cronobacter phage vB_CsaP_GAP52 TaxID=1141137 RepID=K4F6U9_9CAUD|nr:hypothetical protein D858_gp083 [Cronobacter phage vB_CsaP_GAP52]AFC22026.1 hypothetical protein GAP52_032 [Cronobacter phage vB_CsaP_GAP52]
MIGNSWWPALPTKKKEEKKEEAPKEYSPEVIEAVRKELESLPF